MEWDLDIDDICNLLDVHMQRPGAQAFVKGGHAALALAQRGFVIVSQREQRPLSIEELEFIRAREMGNVQ
jgi:hypothetical protein